MTSNDFNSAKLTGGQITTLKFLIRKGFIIRNNDIR